MNKWVCSFILFGLCGCAEPRHLNANNDDNPTLVSNLDAWRHFLLHQAHFSNIGIKTGAPPEVEVAALAFESELQQAVVACQLNGFMQDDPNALVAKYRENVLALPIGPKIEAVVLGRLKPHISWDGPVLSSFGNQFSTELLVESIVTDGYQSNCYTYNLEVRTQSMVGPSGQPMGYPDGVRFFPATL